MSCYIREGGEGGLLTLWQANTKLQQLVGNTVSASRIARAAVAQLVEHRLPKPNVAGPSPVCRSVGEPAFTSEVSPAFRGRGSVGESGSKSFLVGSLRPDDRAAASAAVFCSGSAFLGLTRKEQLALPICHELGANR